jgi:1,4-alpha-glucan branching enzyme
MRHAVKTVSPGCLLMAEQLPNDWALTNLGGPMDSQWSDDFHDRTVDVCQGDAGQMGRFADALQISQVSCQQWYNVTNYSESHDEVGNVNDRIAQIGGFGRGLRLNKVAAAATLMSCGIPLLFMGEEAGETRQFRFDADDTLDLDVYESDEAATRVRRWWQELFALRRNNPKIQGPAPLQVHWVEGSLVAFSRGGNHEFFVILNCSPDAVTRSLGHMNLPGASYKELWNSSWPAFQVEWEDEHANGGRDALLYRDLNLNIPDYGVVILERI